MLVLYWIIVGGISNILTPHVCKYGQKMNKKNPPLNIIVVQYITTFNYDLSNKHIIEFTHFQQCHQKLNIINFVKVEFIGELL